MLIGELESLKDMVLNIQLLRIVKNAMVYLDKAESFIDISADRKIIDRNLPKRASLVDHKQASEAETTFIMDHFRFAEHQTSGLRPP